MAFMGATRPDGRPTVRFLGTRGVPAAHGGFETAVQEIGLEMVRRGWRVVVYCQDETVDQVVVDDWRGIERVRISGKAPGALGTIWFDAKAMWHAFKREGTCVTFGYNTAFLNVLPRLIGKRQIINMDGLEWKRAGWSRWKRAYLFIQERIGCYVGNALIADHPVIAEHLATRVRARKITMIPYGAHVVDGADSQPVEDLDLTPGNYWTLIARPVPENSILELVRGFSARERGFTLAVLGNYDVENCDFHREVVAAAGPEVKFCGGIYDANVLASLRYHAAGYVHGHTVGGTNPSLVEALGAGNAVLAHDNQFNRWVAQDAALYFATEAEIDAYFTALEAQEDRQILSKAATARHEQEFDWPRIVDSYERLIDQVRGGNSGPLSRTPVRAVEEPEMRQPVSVGSFAARSAVPPTPPRSFARRLVATMGIVLASLGLSACSVLSSVGAEDQKAEQTGAEVSVEAATEPVPAPDPGAGKAVSDGRQKNRKPTPVGETATTDGGLEVTITTIDKTSTEAKLPGEIAGPAIALSLTVSNGSKQTINLDQITVSVLVGPRRVPASLVSSSTDRLSGELKPGDSAQAHYVYSRPQLAEGAKKARIEVNTAGEKHVVVFKGEMK